MLSNIFDPKFPSRPAITEIYGECLPSFGHDVTWIMPSFDRRENFNKNHYKKVDIYTIYFGNSFFKPLNSFLHYLRKLFYLNRLLKENEYELIQVRNNIFDSLLVLLLKKRYKFVFVFQYSFPKGFYYKNSKKLSYAFIKIEDKIANYIIKKADFVLPISKGMKQKLMDCGIPNKKMMPLPLGANVKQFSPENKKNLREKYQLNKKTIFLYIGTLDRSRRLEIIINAFSKVVKFKNDVCLLVVGSGNSENDLKKITRELKLDDNVIFTGKISYFNIPDHIFTADICLSPIPPLPIFVISSPTKLFEYMALEKPIIGNKGIIEQEEVLNESKGGLLVNFDADSFADAMIELLKDPEKSKSMGQNGRKWVKKNRDYKKMSLNIEKLYFTLTKKMDDKII